MIHFVYPNVKLLEQTFIGCGRYLAAEEAPGEDYTLADPKITKKLADLHTAADKLAPDSLETGKRIWEKQDRPGAVYTGDSQNLAYLLALISRSRFLKLSLQGDIWCTGVITFREGGRPVLEAIDPKTLTLKLKAFLSDDNSVVVS